MRLEQLEYVLAVSRHGSLRRASEQLHASQPAVSEAISKLERELGVTLLDRHRTGARISAAGQELLPTIVEVLESAERLRVTATDDRAVRRILRLGTVNAGTAALVLPAVRDFQASHPNASIELRDLQQQEIQVALAAGALEIGVVNLSDDDDPVANLVVTPLITGLPVVVLPAGHRLIERSAVTADDLRAEPFIAMRCGYVMHRLARRLFGDVTPTAWHSVDGAEMGKLMVSEGIGVAVLPDYSVANDPLERAGLIVTRPLAGDHPTMTMAAVRRQQPRVPHVVSDMIALLKRHAVTSHRQRVHMLGA